jgi:copper(I)-binding protein
MLMAGLWARRLDASLWHNRRMKKHTVAVALLALSAAVSGHEFKIGGISIGHPYARPTGPSQSTGGGYLTLTSKGTPDRLVSASATISESVQLHSMRLEGDVMRMREIGSVEMPADTRVEMKPGGLHLMFVGLKAPLKVGQSFPLKLKFEKAGEVTVDVKVDAMASSEMRHEKAH